MTMAELAAGRDGNVKKWRGGVKEILMECPVAAAWELCSDWAHWQRWWPAGELVSELRKGDNRKPGAFRYLETAPDVWINERLLELDDATFFMKYNMEDNVFCGGVTGYVAQCQLRGTSEGQTMLQFWTWEVEPLSSMSEEAFTSFMEGFFKGVLVKGIERGAQRLTQGLDPKPPAGETATAEVFN